MLPATKSRRFSLADVVPSCLSAISGERNPLALARVDKAVVVVVDGLGSSSLAANSGHARTLAPLLSPTSIIGSPFPTTTAAALATLTTGQPSGVHGLVGYTVLDSANDRVVNELSGWDDRLDPATWQRVPTLFEKARETGVPSYAIGSERYRTSGFTEAVLRGAEYRSGVTLADRFAEARRTLDAIDRGLVYLYIPELDQAGHAHGGRSAHWAAALEELDAEVRAFAATLGRREGMLLTADHGMVDVDASSHVFFDRTAALVDGVRFVAGEPRALQLHLEPDLGEAGRADLLESWREAEGHRSWIVSRREAVRSGWFGSEVAADVEPRIGDILVAARKAIAYYDSRLANRSAETMIGQHGSWSPEETSVPLLRFGAWSGG